MVSMTNMLKFDIGDNIWYWEHFQGVPNQGKVIKIEIILDKQRNAQVFYLTDSCSVFIREDKAFNTENELIERHNEHFNVIS